MTIQQRIYNALIWLHPASFRRQFGRDMSLDFKDALTAYGFPRLLLDATHSLARQWTACIASGEDNVPNGQTPSLLAGQYLPICDRGLNAAEWSRGLLASALFLTLCGYLVAAGPHRPVNDGIVYAAMQVIANPPDDTAPRGNSSHQQFVHFDVASIRESKTGAPTYVNFPFSSDNAWTSTHGFMQATALPLSAYIQFAYKMNALQVVAFSRQLPGWAASVRYDIEARVEGDPTKEDMRCMLRALLASRFKLQLRQETATGDVYNLELLHPGNLGPSLQPHAATGSNCKEDPSDPSSNACSRIDFSVPDATRQVVRMTGQNVPLDRLLFYATTQSGRPVLDKTGLTGDYDFTLEYAQQRYNQTPGDMDPDSSNTASETFPDALRDQLGLKLIPAKGPVIVYTLDSIDRPTPN